MTLPASKDDALDDIIALGHDYDGLTTVDDLKGLIDDLVKIATLARAGKYFYETEPPK